ncbi:membrane protein [Bacteroidia bacterium]|nr:membrane protein [Bacteroidia bacterium]
MTLNNIIEITGVVSAVIYTWLELKQRSAMWIVGILSSLMYVVVTFQSDLYAYMVLYIYYVAISVYGLYQWKFGARSTSQPEKELPVSHIRQRHIIVLLPITIGLSAALYYVLGKYADAPMPAVEAAGTALSIVATWMLTKKLLEHWLVWIVADSISAALFFCADRYPSTALSIFYAAIAVYGYFKWRGSIASYGDPP